MFLSSSLTFRRTHILADKLGRLCYLCFSFIFLIVLWCTYLLTVLFTMLNLGEAGALSFWGGYVIEDLGWNLTGWPHACCWCCNFRCKSISDIFSCLVLGEFAEKQFWKIAIRSGTMCLDGLPSFGGPASSLNLNLSLVALFSVLVIVHIKRYLQCWICMRQVCSHSFWLKWLMDDGCWMESDQVSVACRR